MLPVSGSSAASCGTYILGSSLGCQSDVKEVALLWLNEMFISCGESLLAKKKSSYVYWTLQHLDS